MKASRYTVTYECFDFVCARLRGNYLGRIFFNNKEIYGTVGISYDAIELDMKNWIHSNPKAKDILNNFQSNLILRKKIYLSYDGIDIRVQTYEGFSLAVGHLKDKKLFETKCSTIDEAVASIKVDIDNGKDRIKRTLEDNHQTKLKDYRVSGREQISCVSVEADDANFRSAHCWYCHHPIDSIGHLKCTGCGWILCFCGACGCSYKMSKNF